MKIYISGKITGLEIDYAKKKFEDAEQLLKIAWPTIINPFHITPFLWIRIWHCYMIADIFQLLKCDTIFMMLNWEDSRGARIEHRIAKRLNYRIIYEKKPIKNKIAI